MGRDLGLVLDGLVVDSQHRKEQKLSLRQVLGSRTLGSFTEFGDHLQVVSNAFVLAIGQGVVGSQAVH